MLLYNFFVKIFKLFYCDKEYHLIDISIMTFLLICFIGFATTCSRTGGASSVRLLFVFVLPFLRRRLFSLMPLPRFLFPLGTILFEIPLPLDSETASLLSLVVVGDSLYFSRRRCSNS